jgi:hypothetical protein
MPASLTWVDHDPAARERSLRILALFQEKESRDELGLGGIRDSFADQLFPGTSTIQTRLRYILFVPWIYTRLEQQRVPPADFAARADRGERGLVTPLLAADDRSGVFGAVAGKGLKRLPSSVYWAGLGAWGIRLIDLSQDQYHRQIGAIYRRRAVQAALERERAKMQDDPEAAPEPGTLTWHPRLPEPPAGFPAQADFSLTREEAGFLLDRLQCSHPHSLLAYLALHSSPVEAEFAWQHPDRAGFREEHQELLTQARRFSEALHGAALVYNLALAELRPWDEKVTGYREWLSRWAASLDLDDLHSWALPRLWQLTLGQGHAITPATRLFVERWLEMARSQPAGLVDSTEARDLVRRREMSLKKARSRFTNRRALEQWGGASGLARLKYRWPNAQEFLRDLHAGLHRGA